MRNITKLGLMAGSAFLVVLPLVRAQDSGSKDSLQKRLKDQYPMTKLSADRQTVITAGSVLTLKVDGLVMVPSSAAADTGGNTYKDGKIGLGTIGKTNEVGRKIDVIRGHLPIPIPRGPARTSLDTRMFKAGEKLNVTKIDVADDKTISFELYSYQAYSDVYYRATLKFPGAKKGAPVPTDDKVVSTVAEVFTVAPAETVDTKTQESAGAGQVVVPQNGEPTSEPRAQPTQTQQYPDIQPPPPPQPPPPTPPLAVAPRKIAPGMTIVEVKAAGYGEPDNLFDLGSRVIFQYKKASLKVTFVDGKVSLVE